MGQKVNPFSLRLPIMKNWQSKWFGKQDFAEFIKTDLAIRNAITKKYNKNAGIGKVDVNCLIGCSSYIVRISSKVTMSDIDCILSTVEMFYCVWW